MLKGISISYTLADEITVANLKDMRTSLLQSVDGSAKNFSKTHEQENLRESYKTLFAIEEVLRYVAGDKWND